MTKLLWVLFFSFFVWIYQFNAQAAEADLVTDEAHLLTSSDAATLNAQLAELQASSGLSARVVISETLGAQSVDDAARQVFESLKAKDAKIENGVLLFATSKERVAQIVVGSGLESKLPAPLRKRILDENFVPFAAMADAPSAVRETFVAIRQVVVDGKLVNKKSSVSQVPAITAAGLAGAIILSLLSTFSNIFSFRKTAKLWQSSIEKKTRADFCVEETNKSISFASTVTPFVFFIMAAIYGAAYYFFCKSKGLLTDQLSEQLMPYFIGMAIGIPGGLVTSSIQNSMLHTRLRQLAGAMLKAVPKPLRAELEALIQTSLKQGATAAKPNIEKAIT